jgi:uncharacterized phosphosugar-binding protein
VAWPGQAAAGPAEEYIDGQIRVALALDKGLEAIVTAADESAERLVSGGRLYLAGERGMVLEVLGRAGGPCGAKMLALDRPLPSLGNKDVVLLSDYGLALANIGEQWKKVTATGALIVAFAATENPLLRGPLPANVRAIPIDIPCDSRLAVLPSGERQIPLAPPAIAMGQWTYVAELLGACRRQHKQLAIYLSIFLDEGHRRYQRTKDLLLEPDLKPDPVAKGEYARQYLNAARRGLEAIRQCEMENVRKAACWIQEARTAKHAIFRNLHGHLPPAEIGLPGDVSFFAGVTRATGDAGVKWSQETLHEGDVYLFLGYQENEDAMATAANAAGARTIFLTSKASGPEQSKSPRHLYLNPHWPATDACLDLPGYDVKACPLSCVLGLTCYYAICNEVVSGSSVK